MVRLVAVNSNRRPPRDELAEWADDLVRKAKVGAVAFEANGWRSPSEVAAALRRVAREVHAAAAVYEPGHDREVARQLVGEAIRRGLGARH